MEYAGRWSIWRLQNKEGKGDLTWSELIEGMHPLRPITVWIQTSKLNIQWSMVEYITHSNRVSSKKMQGYFSLQTVKQKSTPQ